MTPHDWQPAPKGYEPIWKESEEWINRNIKVALKPGVYICDRCKNDARVYFDGALSLNWNSDCDECMISGVHSL